MRPTRAPTRAAAAAASLPACPPPITSTSKTARFVMAEPMSEPRRVVKTVSRGTSSGSLNSARFAVEKRNRMMDFDAAHKDKLGESKHRSEENTSELQSLMRISYAVFCSKKQNKLNKTT